MTEHGYLALVLHAHLPYVRHPEYPEFLEEHWLFEAITETYLPLLGMLDRLSADHVPFALTLTLTPPLCAMLRDELLRERYLRNLDASLVLAEKETVRTRGRGREEETAAFYLERLRFCRRQYLERWQGDLIGAFRRFQDDGVLEIITCAATHGLLPLMANIPQAVRAQIFIARDDYRACFGRDPAGIWLPECAYVAGIDQILQEANLRWFILDAHGLMFGQPRPRRAIYAPCFTPAGPAAFSRDRESSRQVWSAQHGYPGDPAYRDFYRDIGFELPLEELAPVVGPEGPRQFTGFKYHRITGRTQDKELYHRVWAMAAADSHAGHFMEERRTQIENLRRVLDVDPIVVAPFDAELFGHWWFEGPEFLELFIRKAVYDQHVFTLTTPGRYLNTHTTHQMVAPSASSWGQNGYWEVWLHPSNSWIYPHLQTAAQRMVEAARAEAKQCGFLARTTEQGRSDERLRDRLLRQMARELLLAQSSDWAFLMKTGTATHYAAKRTRDHILRFTRLYEQWRSGAVDPDFLANCEWRDNLFPDLNWRYYV
jgi:1,4-alpha-glucan branching enzyme